MMNQSLHLQYSLSSLDTLGAEVLSSTYDEGRVAELIEAAGCRFIYLTPAWIP
ncbi:hypothetical protein O77CONTIG1_02628 [Leptolyngbya sp. O-77]|nr:hypothetical protein O77CONTIG1_02628 [Leptolyngbya sp. O-77]